MSSLTKIKKNRLIKQLENGKEVIISVFAFFAFLISSAVIIKNINPVKEDVPNYFELSKNPYVKYEELLDRADLKKIMDNRQFLEMRYDENIIKEEDPFERDDPFMDKFGDEYENEDESGENNNDGDGDNWNNWNDENNDSEENRDNEN